VVSLGLRQGTARRDGYHHRDWTIGHGVSGGIGKEHWKWSIWGGGVRSSGYRKHIMYFLLSLFSLLYSFFLSFPRLEFCLWVMIPSLNPSDGASGVARMYSMS